MNFAAVMHVVTERCRATCIFGVRALTAIQLLHGKQPSMPWSRVPGVLSSGNQKLVLAHRRDRAWYPSRRDNIGSG